MIQPLDKPIDRRGYLEWVEDYYPALIEEWDRKNDFNHFCMEVWHQQRAIEDRVARTAT